MKNINKKSTRKCYECGKEIEGRAGAGYHVITSKYGFRYYCLECVERIRNENNKSTD